MARDEVMDVYESFDATIEENFESRRVWKFYRESIFFYLDRYGKKAFKNGYGRSRRTANGELVGKFANASAFANLTGCPRSPRIFNPSILKSPDKEFYAICRTSQPNPPTGSQ